MADAGEVGRMLEYAAQWAAEELSQMEGVRPDRDSVMAARRIQAILEDRRLPDPQKARMIGHAMCGMHASNRLDLLLQMGARRPESIDAIFAALSSPDPADMDARYNLMTSLGNFARNALLVDILSMERVERTARAVRPPRAR